MTVTFAQLQSRVSKRLLDTSNTAVALSDVQDAINDAIKAWKYKRFWFNEGYSTVTLVASDPIIYLTSITDFLIELPGIGFTIIYNNCRYKLTKKRPDFYDNENTQATGRPYIYTWRGGQYLCYFYPDQAYTLGVKYLKEYTALSGNADYNDFTNNADDLIMYDALAKLHGEIRQDEKMESYYTARTENEYNRLLSVTRKFTASGSLDVDTIL